MTNKDLTVTLVQYDIYWEDKERNISYLNDILNNLKTQSDLIILPEMFTTGFSTKATNLAESMDGDTIKWLLQSSKNINSVIIGSIIINEDNKYYNRLICAYPDGKLYHYDKRHLFRFGGEHERFNIGQSSLIIDIKGWKIKPLVCYDLRFPVWSRNCNDYDLLIYVANWPSARNSIWEKLLMARAIENLSYTIGVNRIGKDEQDNYHVGNSMVVNYKGNIISDIAPEKESVYTLNISYNDLIDFRNKFPVHLDADKFVIL